MEKLYTETDLIDERYKNAIIYKLTFKNTDLKYFGTTTEGLKTRFSKHKEKYLFWCKSGVSKEGGSARFYSYYPILIEQGTDDFEIELVKKFPCNNRYELEREEYRLVKENDNAINKRTCLIETPLVKCLRCGVVLKKKGFKKHYETTRCLKFENKKIQHKDDE